MIPLTPLAIVAVTVPLALALQWIAQRAYFDPLAKYPGPFLAKFTGLYAAYHAWRGDIHLDIARSHEKYGPFVRYGPNRLLVNSMQGLRDIYSTSATKAIRKSQAYGALVHRVPNTFTLLDKREHSWRRRVLTQGFSEQVMRDIAEPAVLSCVERLRASIIDGHEGPDGWSEPKDMSDWCSYFSFDVMSRVIFGQDYNMLGSAEHRSFVEDLRRSNVRISVLYNDTLVKRLKLDKWLFPNAMKGRKGFLQFIGMFLKPKLASIIDTERSLSRQLETAKDPETGNQLSATQIRAETATLIAAGMDTTSTALASIMFYLANFPGTRRRLEDEIRSTFGKVDEIRDGVKLRECKYLAAVINESIRVSPPAGGPLWRTVEPEGWEVDGHTVMGGTDVGAGIYAVQHNEALFPDASSFEPERWLEGSVDSRCTPAAFIPFSFGPRGCLGKPLSMLEMRLLTAQLVWRYDMALAGGSLGQVGRGSKGMGRGRESATEFQLWDHINAVNNGPYVSFRRRQPDGMQL